MRFLTVTLNAAIDATYVVDRFAHGDANRALRRHARPGGKGNNVARVLAGMGEAVTASGYLAGHAGREIESGLREAGITPRFAWLAHGESRTCHTILEADTGIATEILERGPQIGANDMTALLGVLGDLVPAVDAVIVSGSAPPGATPEFLHDLARIARAGTARFVVDTSGPSLAALLAGRPDVIKPNETEIRQLMGHPAPLAAQVGFVQRDLIGTRLAPDARVILSRGREGAVLVTATGVLSARPPEVPAVNTVGSGDALLAGFARAWANGARDVDALRAGVATGTAATLREVAGEVGLGDVERLRPLVEVTDHAPVA